MAQEPKSGLYTPVSMDVLRKIASTTKNPKLVVAYLALANHTDGRSIAGHPPHTLTGAGANKVKKLCAVAERTASLLVNSLLNQGFISKAPEAARKEKSRLTYLLHPEGNTVDIPRSLIDGLDMGGYATEGITRIWSLASDEKALAAIMLLLELYASTDMERWGGISPRVIHRAWQTDAAAPADGCAFRWIAQASKVETSYLDTLSHAMEWSGLVYTKGNDEDQDNRLRTMFWDAWGVLKKSRLIYETVYVVDGESPVVPIRVNDFHSDADRDGGGPRDPSFLKINEGLGFYTPAKNELEDPEGVWFYWDMDPSAGNLEVKGIFRPRFRAANPSTSRGIIRDRDAAKDLLARVDAALVAGADKD